MLVLKISDHTIGINFLWSGVVSDFTCVSNLQVGLGVLVHPVLEKIIEVLDVKLVKVNVQFVHYKLEVVLTFS